MPLRLHEYSEKQQILNSSTLPLSYELEYDYILSDLIDGNDGGSVRSSGRGRDDQGNRRLGCMFRCHQLNLKNTC